jgi:hypothetical protein
MSISGSFKSKTGRIRVEVLDGGQPTTVEIDELGSLKYEFDLIPDKPEVDAVQALYNKIDISIFQYSHYKEDLYERLRQRLIEQKGIGVRLSVFQEGAIFNDLLFISKEGNVQPLLDLTFNDGSTNLTLDGMYFVESNGSTFLIQGGYVEPDQVYSFDFFIQLNDISLSEVDRTIEMDCRVRYNPNAPALAVFDRIESENPTLLKTFLPDEDNAGETLDCTGVADWIDAAMRDVFLNENTSIIRSADVDLPFNYAQKNYTSLSDGIPPAQTGFIMARMRTNVFEGFEEWQDGQGRISYEGNDGTDRGTFGGQNFEGILKKGYKIRVNLLFGEQDNPGGQFNDEVELIIDEVESDTVFYTENIPVSQGVIATQRSVRTYEYAVKVSTGDIFALETLQELAAIEGSIFGTGFGKNFFANRLQSSDVKLIDWQNIVDMDTNLFYNPLGGGFVLQVARYYSSLKDLTKNIGAENYGIWPTSSGNWELPLITDGKSQLEEIRGNDTQINLRLAPGYPFLNKAIGKKSQGYFLGKYESPVPWQEDYSTVLALCRSGLLAMKKALSSDGGSDVIEFEMFGVESIMPWNLIRFRGAKPKYSNKLFRPTELEYDFVNDMVKCVAYEVKEFEKREYEITVNGNVHASGQVVTKLQSQDIYNIDVEGNVHASGVVETDEPARDAILYMDGSVTTEVFTNTTKEIQVSGNAHASGFTLTDPPPVQAILFMDGTVETLVEPSPPPPSVKTIAVTGEVSSSGVVFTNPGPTLAILYMDGSVTTTVE